MMKFVSAAATLAVAAAASASSWSWNWTSAQGGGSISNVAGTFKAISASYDDVTKVFTWNTTFSDKVTTGFTLAVNDGPNPKGKPGELALIYFDATSSMSNPKVSVFGYNGANSYNSYVDGDGVVAGNQAPKLVKAAGTQSQLLPWLLNANVVDSAAGRTFSLSIDATSINNYVNSYSAQYGVAWTGIHFDDQVGLWQHTFKSLTTHYTGGGQLDNWSSGTQGYFDGSNFSTLLAIPLPTGAGMGLAGLLGVGIAIRRRHA